MLQLYDTTLRDGTQGEGVSFSADDKLRIARRLDRFGMHYIEGGWPGSNPKDAEFFTRSQDLELAHAKITAFGSTRRADVAVEEDGNVKALLATKVKVAAIFGKSWDFHVTHALRTTLDENLAMIADTVRYLKEQGLEVIYDAEHFYDGWKRHPDYALATVAAAEEAGADVIVLCDTNGGSMPHEIQAGCKVVQAQISCPLGIHAHNDCGLGVANTLAAVEAGAVHIQGTVNGYGERCGNADLIQVIPNLQLKLGIPCVSKENLQDLADLSRYVSELANLSPDDHRPFVGRSVFAHKGGVHVSATLRNPETYEHIKPELVGNRRRVLVSELSGTSNIIYKAREYNVDLEKNSPAMRTVVKQVKELEHQGFHFEGAEASFELILKKALHQYQPYFDLISLRILMDKADLGEGPATEVTIKVRVGERIVHTVGEGNGPVHALDAALRSALEEAYPTLGQIQLADYKVRVLDEEAGTAARVRVLIVSSCDGRSWGTVGVSTNIIEASWQALVDSYEYGLMSLDVAPVQAAAPSAVGE